jgi:phosphatidylserine/phosphatidylglycerophosphate/cardiolipin synthase-like enzyme
MRIFDRRSIAAVLVAWFFAWGLLVGRYALPKQAPLEIGFSPEGSCHELVAHAVEGARRSIRIQAYGFTNETIVGLVAAAARRGVSVEVLIDRSEAARDMAGKPAPWREVVDAGGRVYVDSSHPIAHNKVLIVDGELAEFGSFNYTAQAERNAENCAITHNGSDVDRYVENWDRHREHSEPAR